MDGSGEILKANGKDIEKAEAKGMAPGLIDRLRLTPSRIEGIVEGMRQVADLEDPIGEVLSMKKRPNGLLIGQKRVPLGVVGMIYEARPNVTADAFALCFKTGNAVILKGGSDALFSNEAIVACIKKGLSSQGITEDAVQLITDTDHKTTQEFMQMREYLDVLIPRGGAGLIRAVVENSKVPVIETGRETAMCTWTRAQTFPWLSTLSLTRKRSGSASATPVSPRWFTEKLQNNSCRF